MGILVEIKNKQHEGSVVYYTIPYTGFTELLPFKIGIDTEKKYVYIYKDLNIHDMPIKVIDFNDEDKPIEKCQIPSKVIGIIIIRVLKCFRENNFPDDISYCA